MMFIRGHLSLYALYISPFHTPVMMTLAFFLPTRSETEGSGTPFRPTKRNKIFRYSLWYFAHSFPNKFLAGNLLCYKGGQSMSSY